MSPYAICSICYKYGTYVVLLVADNIAETDVAFVGFIVTFIDFISAVFVNAVVLVVDNAFTVPPEEFNITQELGRVPYSVRKIKRYVLLFSKSEMSAVKVETLDVPL